MKKLVLFGLLLALPLVLVGCGGEKAAPQPPSPEKVEAAKAAVDDAAKAGADAAKAGAEAAKPVEAK